MHHRRAESGDNAGDGVLELRDQFDRGERCLLGAQHEFTDADLHQHHRHLQPDHRPVRSLNDDLFQAHGSPDDQSDTAVDTENRKQTDRDSERASQGQFVCGGALRHLFPQGTPDAQMEKPPDGSSTWHEIRVRRVRWNSRIDD